MMRSLFAGVSGLKSHQTRMDVVGNNISNINTVGFKSSRVTFADMLSQTQTGASSPAANLGGTNPKQIGLGAAVASIDLIFNDGSPQATGKNTDVALSGNGLFVLRSGSQYYYTRDGAFEFDAQGNYVLPGSGYYVQGWNAVDGSLNTNATPTNIVVPAGKTMEATSTTSINFTGNLNSASPIITGITYTAGTGNGVSGSKVITGGTILGLDYYESDTSTTPTRSITSLSSADHATIYYKSDYKSDGTPAAEFDDTYTAEDVMADESLWDEYGIFTDTITASSYTGTTTVGEDYIKSVNVDGKNAISAVLTLSDGTSQRVTTGYYQLGHSIPVTTSVSVYDSEGGTHAVTVLLDKVNATQIEIATLKEQYFTGTSDTAQAYQAAKAASPPDNDTIARIQSEYDEKLAEYNNRWMVYIAPAEGENKYAVTYKITESDGSTTTGYLNRVTVDEYNSRVQGTEREWLYQPIDTDTSSTVPYYGGAGLIQFNQDGSLNVGDTVNSSLLLHYSDGNGSAETTSAMDFSGLTQYSGGSTAYPTANGNAFGVLQSVAIDSAGIITGTYTNGVRRFEAQIAVAQFVNASGLTKVGTSLYLESNNSGTANIKTVTNLGLTVTPSALEMSNVELASELSDMIITQRGFQSNSKIITVADEMLETLINMKR